MVTTVRSGRAVAREFDQALDRFRKDTAAHSVSAQRLEEQLRELLQRRSKALVELAQHYLPELNQAAVDASHAEIREDLLGVLARQQARRRELEAQIDAIRGQTAELEQQLQEVTQQLDEKAAKRDDLEQQLAERLRTSDEFQVVSKQAIQAELELEKNEARVEEIRREAEEKLPSYDKSRLFQYLRRRDYGTPSYEKDGLVRRLDGWIARMIDYPSARQSYRFLQTTPDLIAAEVARRRSLFDELMERVEAIEDRVADEIGLTELMRAGQELGGRRDTLVGELETRQQQIEQLERRIVELTGGHSEFYEQAVARLKIFLANIEESRLAKTARATPDRRDDAIVAEVLWLNNQIKAHRRESTALAGQHAAAEDLFAGLQEVRQRFRRAEFDSARSLFDHAFSAGREIERYLAGRIGPEGLWNSIRQHQHFAPTTWQDGPPSGGMRFDDNASEVLMRVMTEVAGAALRHAVSRGVARRGATRSRRRSSRGRPPLPRRGFTKGRGF